MNRREACALLGTGVAGLSGGCLGTLGSLTTTHVSLHWSEATGRETLVREALAAGGLPDDVRVHVTGSSLVDSLGALERQLAADDGSPELFVVGANLAGEDLRLTDATHGLPDLRTVVGADVADDTFRAGRAAMRRGGRLVGLPLFVVPSLVLYRRDWLSAAGYDTSGWATAPPTWADFASMVREVRDGRSVDGVLFETVSGDRPRGLFSDLLTAAGGAYFGDPSRFLFGPVGDRPVTVDDAAGLRAATMLRSLVTPADGDLPTGVRGLGATGAVRTETAVERVLAGEAVACRADARYLGRFDATDRERVGVVPAPRVGGVDDPLPWTGGPASSYHGQYAALNAAASGDAREAATAVLRAMATDGFVAHLFGRAPGVTDDGSLSWLPARPSAYDSNAVVGSPLGRYVPALRTAATVGLTAPVTSVWSEEYGVVDGALGSIIDGDDPAVVVEALGAALRDLEAGSAGARRPPTVP